MKRDQESEQWPANSATRPRRSGYSPRHDGQRASLGRDSSMMERTQTREDTSFVRSSRLSNRPQRPQESRFGHSQKSGDAPYKVQSSQDTRYRVLSRFLGRSQRTQDSRAGQPSRSGDRSRKTQQTGEPLSVQPSSQTSTRGEDQKAPVTLSSDERGRSTSASRVYPSLYPRERLTRSRFSEVYSNDFCRQVSDTREAGVYVGISSSPYRSSPDSSQPYEAVSPRPRESSYRANKRPPLTGTSDQFSRQRTGTSERPGYALTTEKGVPLSIPYTTPASEFLYVPSLIQLSGNG